jgi:hypothetical protein
LHIFQRLGDHHREAQTRCLLGHTYLRMGDAKYARSLRE